MKKLFHTFIFGLLCALYSFGQHDRYETEMRLGTLGVGNALTLTDPLYLTPSITAEHYLKREANVYLRISDQVGQPAPITSYKVKVNLTAKSWDQSGSSSSENFSFTMTYDQASNTSYTGLQVARTKRAHRIVVKVTSITWNDCDPTPCPTTPPKNLYIGAIMEFDRTVQYGTSGLAQVTSVTEQITNTPTNKNAKVSWAPVEGALWYDLEYTYVWGTVNTNKYDFSERSTRVQVPAGSPTHPSTYSYEIPLIYPDGYLVWRIRAVSKTADQYRNIFYGPWSLTAASGTISSLPANHHHNIHGNNGEAHNPKLNWQHKAVFAEDAKRKDVIQYLDGTLRNRQSITSLSSEELILVQDQIYDYHGRPAISTLPAPTNSTPNKALRYQSGFTLNSSDERYSYKDLLWSGSCTAVAADTMSTTSGASRYYSPSNPNNTEHQAHLPDARKRPFVQTEYTPDNTGRIQRKSLPGGDHALYSGHETVMRYGVPSQNELDILFGNDVGYSSFYRKKMTRDPNGQLSLEYVDLEGSVIATALAGDKPAAYEAIPSYASNNEQMTVEMIPEIQAVDLIDGTIRFSQKFLVESDDDSQSFSYQFSPQAMQQICDSICATCVYDLEVMLEDECGNLVYSLSETIGNPDSVLANGTCDTSLYELTLSAGITLGIGEYTLSKVLQVNQEAVDNATAAYIDSCANNFSLYYNQELALADDSACNDQVPCEEMAAEIVREQDYSFSQTRYTEDSTAYATGACGSSDPCYMALVQMLVDVSPGGQYGHYLTTDPNWTHSVYNSSSGNSWNNLPSGTQYTDENGDPAYVIVHSDGTTYIPPVSSSANPTDLGGGLYRITPNELDQRSDFVALFQASWAEALLSLHPEYNCYLNCVEKLRPAFIFENELNHTGSFADAVADGYINSGGMLQIPGTLDPHFTTAGSCADLSGFNGKLDAYLTSLYSIENIAYAITAKQNFSLGSFSLQGCDKDLYWTILRTLYLSARYGHVVDSCGYLDCTIPSGSGYQSVFFPDPGDDLKDMFGDPLPNGTTANNWMSTNIGSTSMNAGNVNNCYTYCQSLADSWILALEGCDQVNPNWNSTANITTLKNALIDICKWGCDQGYPSGTSTAPGLSPYNSFQAAIKALVYNGSAVTNPDCTAELITTPGPYLGPLPANNSALMARIGLSPLDTCSCELILSVKDEFDTLKANNNLPEGVHSLEGYFYYIGKGVPDIGGLVCACEDVISPSSWNTGFNWTDAHALSLQQNYSDMLIPNSWSCEDCINCNQLNTAVDYLSSKYKPGFSLQDNAELVARFLSTTHNIQLSAMDVIDFKQACDSNCIKVKDCREIQEIARALHLILVGFPSLVHTQNLPGQYSSQWSVLQPYINPAGLSHPQIRTFFETTPTGNKFVVAFFANDVFELCRLEFDLGEYSERDLSKSKYKFNSIAGLWALDCSVWNIALSNGKGWMRLRGYTNCFSDICENEPITLCSQNFPFTEDPCTEDLEAIAYHNATVLYGQYIDSLSNDFRNDYISSCLGLDQTTGLAEELKRTYDYTLHHFTLYYYDQVGNLTKTVPPAGVSLLTSAQITTVQNFRAGTTIMPATYPTHSKGSTYTFNTYNQIVRQSTPDAGGKEFFYDLGGRLVASRDAASRTAYTLYDGQDRVFESGRMYSSTSISSGIAQDAFLYRNWVSGGTAREVSRTWYDEPNDPTIANEFYNGAQERLRNRVAAMAYFPEYSFNTSPISCESAKYFSYDSHGNVKELLNYLHELKHWGHGYKGTLYDYDLISGNVKRVHYSPNGRRDRLEHRYEYDSDNRITEVYTNQTELILERDARYTYYHHGPLARLEIGQDDLQGVDYAYTIQGWLKGINAAGVASDEDLGGDGTSSGHPDFARDAYGFVLNYYSGDYKPIVTGGSNGLTLSGMSSVVSPTDLYNGNISAMSSGLLKIDESAVSLGMSKYRYDQLNRITSRNWYEHAATNTTDWAGATSGNKYKSLYSYDADGNLDTLERWGATGSQFDDLDYEYYSGLNRLKRVDDPSGTSTGVGDLADQTGNNYQYDATGNLIQDNSENFTDIEWGINGKIRHIEKNGNPELEFKYGPDGNRTEKIIKSGRQYQRNWDKYVYVTDMQGNVLMTYQSFHYSTTLHKLGVRRKYIYGSGRLGHKKGYGVVYHALSNITYHSDGSFNTFHVNHSWNNSYNSHKMIAGKNNTYELTNHLGNVLSTISDRTYISATSTSGNIISKDPDVHTYQDYYPFGMLMPGRHDEINGNPYTYGYNRHERDDEVKGAGKHLNWGGYGMDPRLGRRWNIDPQWQKLPGQSPYSVNNNNPIQYTDPNGEIGLIGAAIGAVVGGIVELGSQVVSNVVQGKPAFEKIDWADVAISVGEGTLAGATGGLSLLAHGGFESAKAAIDFKDGKFHTIGGIIGKEKNISQAGIDLGAGLIGMGVGKLLPVGDAVANQVAKSGIKNNAQILVSDLATGLLTNSLIGGTASGLFNKGADALNNSGNDIEGLTPILLPEVEVSAERKEVTREGKITPKGEKKVHTHLKTNIEKHRKEE